jgi:hypothetical protein
MSNVTVVSTTVTPRLRLNLVATIDFGVGEVVLQCSEHEIQSNRTWRTVQIDHDRHLKNEFLAYVDHSCAPNSLFEIETLSLRAIREIGQGQPIAFFYPGSEVELAQSFLCHCGASDCLRDIRGGFYLTRQQMRWALDQGYCTSFIRRQFTRLLEGAD